MTKELKDWTKQIEGLAEMDLDGVTNLYSDMLATAHDLGYKVPDEQLIETEDPEQLKKVIPPLHEGIVTFHSAKLAEEKEKAAAAKAAKAPAKKAAAKKSVAKKPAKPAAQKDVSKETEMATATTAKKAAAPKKAATKKTAKAPAKKAAKKAASANARTPAAGRFTGTEVITVKLKDNPARAGSGVHDRVANLMKFSGKTVDAFLKSSLGRTSTLHNAVKKGWITLK